MGPRLSIVIPTRDRARLLRSAVASALSQPDDDLELVVVDQESDDETAAVLDAVDDRRLVRARVPRLGSQALDWEAAVDRATGEWLAVLGDDDAVVPSFLRRLRPAMEQDADVVVFRRAYYHHDDWPEPELRRSLTVYPATGAVYDVDSAVLLDALLRRRDGDDVPLIGNNAVVRRHAWEQVREVAGSALRPPMPDYAFAAALLLQVQRCIVVDQPLAVIGAAPTSAGHSVQLGDEAGRAFLRRSGPLPVVAALKAESIEASLAALPAALVGGRRVDAVRQLATVHADLRRVGRVRDVGPDRDAWRAALRREPPRRRAEVAVLVAAEQARATAERVRRAAASIGGLAGAVSDRRAKAGSRSPFVHERDVRDIAAAARRVEDVVLAHPPMSSS